jgi:hypothetical protein
MDEAVRDGVVETGIDDEETAQTSQLQKSGLQLLPQ